LAAFRNLTPIPSENPAPENTIFKPGTIMRGFLLFVVVVFLFSTNLYSQQFSAKDFLFASSLQGKKFDSYLNKKRFMPSGRWSKNDTIVNTYSLKEAKKKKKDTLDIKRTIEAFQTKNRLSFTYSTSLKDEYIENVNALKQAGFFCGSWKDTGSLLFQKRDIIVKGCIHAEADEDTIYSLFFNHMELPSPEKIQFAEDLLQFYSHENLVSVFGEKNLIKDVYYFSEKEISKCTVLFPKTSRQAVFIWEDQENFCKPAYLIVGGNTNNASSANYDGLIDENVWRSKEGIYSGMSLHSLIRLNGTSFKFYGKNTEAPYMILPENTGVLNFKKNRIVLGCLNPTSSQLLSNSTVSAGDVLPDNAGIYVFMMMLLPQK
jgi:hypothetical protein